MGDAGIRFAVRRVLAVDPIGRGLQQVVARFDHERPVAQKAYPFLIAPLLTKHNVKVCLTTSGSDWVYRRLFHAAACDSIEDVAHHPANFPTDFMVKVQKRSLCRKFACDHRSHKRNRNQNDIKDRLTLISFHLDHVPSIHKQPKKPVALWH
jgi:hypothetical protein